MVVTRGNQSVNLEALDKIKGETEYALPKIYPVDKSAKGYYESQYSRPGHVALDIAIVEGSDVYSPMAGKVLRTNVMDSRGYGNLIEVLMPNGAIMYFAHLSEFLVKPGDTVKAGQLIGKTGNTWSAPGSSTGPHLHFAVKDAKGSWIPPEQFFGEGPMFEENDTSGNAITLQRTASRMADTQAAQEAGDVPAFESGTSTPPLASPSDGLTSIAKAGWAALTGTVQSTPKSSSAGSSTSSEGLPAGSTMVKIASLGALGDLEIPVRWPRLIAIGLGGLLLIVGLIGVTGKTYKVGTTGSYK
jgi:murein DD-endopeptidase MepM/ murein hydrolase activator NlpD